MKSLNERIRIKNKISRSTTKIYDNLHGGAVASRNQSPWDNISLDSTPNISLFKQPNLKNIYSKGATFISGAPDQLTSKLQSMKSLIPMGDRDIEASPLEMSKLSGVSRSKTLKPNYN